jgi:hypothetical protein
VVVVVVMMMMMMHILNRTLAVAVLTIFMRHQLQISKFYRLS